MPYVDVFIRVAPDTRATAASVPAVRGSAPTLARLHYELLREPYRLTEEELHFQVYCRKHGIAATEAKRRRSALWPLVFAKPLPCLRASPLPKTHGWGVHYDDRGRIALVPMESAEYRRLSGSTLRQLEALRTRRAG